MERRSGIQVRKNILKTAALVIIMALMSACAQVQTETPKEDSNEYPENAIAYLVNLPTKEERGEYNIVETLNLQNTEESFIFVAIKEKTDLKVVEIEIKEDGSFLELGNVFNAKEVPPGFALELIALRPEGAPYYKLLISTNDSEEVTYYVSYNGKDGNPKIEYIYK